MNVAATGVIVLVEIITLVVIVVVVVQRQLPKLLLVQNVMVQVLLHYVMSLLGIVTVSFTANIVMQPGHLMMLSLRHSLQKLVLLVALSLALVQQLKNRQRLQNVQHVVVQENNLHTVVIQLEM